MVLALTLPHPASATPAPGPGLVSASGSHLSVDGHPWTFVGYNMPCAQPFLLDQSQLPYVLAAVANNSKANALRMWFFQHNGGPGNWGPFERLVAAAKADGIRIVPTLVNEWPTCEANPPITTQKSLSWYQGGYRQTGDGYPRSFRDFATAVAAHFAHDPTIAFWQLVNEATAPSIDANGRVACDERRAAQAIRTFADDMVATIHAVDPDHIVSLGTLGGNQCGTVGDDYGYVHAGAIGMCEFHDYAVFDPIATDHSPDGLATRLHQCQALPGGGKPFFVGESGLLSNVRPAPNPEPDTCEPWPTCSPAPVTYESLQLRATLFGAKMTTAFSAGISGYLVWFKGPHFSAANDSYAIGEGDPAEAVMASLSLGTATAATVPDTAALPPLPNSANHRGSWTNSPILLVGGGGLLVLAWLGIWRSRHRSSRPRRDQEVPPRA